MIGIDTNILVRYLVQDDKKQHKLAARVIEKECSETNPGYINVLVICELVWVLARAYGYRRSQIADVVEQILITDTFEVQSSEIVWKALREYRRGAADFSDYVIAWTNRHAGAVKTYTFDSKAGKNDLFRRLP